MSILGLVGLIVLVLGIVYSSPLLIVIGALVLVCGLGGVGYGHYHRDRW